MPPVAPEGTDDIIANLNVKEIVSVATKQHKI